MAEDRVRVKHGGKGAYSHMWQGTGWCWWVMGGCEWWLREQEMCQIEVNGLLV